MTKTININGFAIVDHVFSCARIEKIVSVLRKVSAGMRQPHLQIPEIAEFVFAVEIQELVAPVLGCHARLVRSILFDKTAGKNWSVPWHQGGLRFYGA